MLAWGGSDPPMQSAVLLAKLLVDRTAPPRYDKLPRPGVTPGTTTLRALLRVVSVDVAPTGHCEATDYRGASLVRAEVFSAA